MKKYGQTGHRGANVPRGDQTYTPSSDNTKIQNRTGLYLAKVIDNSDPDYNGHIWVKLVGSYNSSPQDTQEERHNNFTKIRQMIPQGGSITGENYATQYGHSSSPPPVESEVIVAFTHGHQEGVLLGALAPAGRNASMPGFSGSPLEDEGDVVAPTLEKGAFTDQQGNKRPRHPLANPIAIQGIGLDPLRGVGSEGARRESPSRVNGFNTPSGHSLVLDDGTEKFVEGVNYTPDPSRKEGTNKLIRLRSSEGAQLLLNDEAGIVYIMSQTGNSWIQMDHEGNIDVYAAKNISYHSEDTINFYAADAFNVEADTINMKARGGTLNLEAAADDINLYAAKDVNITADLNVNIRAGSDIIETSVGGNIHLNGPVAKRAAKPVVEPLPVNLTVKESINSRVPEHEPYGGHKANSIYLAAQARSSMQTNTNDLTL